MFKRVTLVMLIAFMALNAEPFSKMATTKPVLVQKGNKKMWCGVCGMNLKMFYKTSYIAGDRQYCSIRCLVADMKKEHINLDSVKVIDVTTQKPILAKDAFFVIGSDVKGTMSLVSKLAFSSKSDANKFIKEHGGDEANFKTVVEKAKSSLKKDSAMVGMKKRKMMYPMGKKIFTKKCSSNLDLNSFKAINELKSSIKMNNLCKNINEKQLQAVALYLWDIKRVKKDKTYNIKVTKDDKCPVCGMFVYKYPKWTTQIVYKDGNRLSFDGVKDMMKFYFNRTKYGKFETLTKENISKILVIDYYNQKTIDARDAYFVIGSNITGPMGEELISFENINNAKTFVNDHNGKKIVTFKEIKMEDLK